MEIKAIKSKSIYEASLKRLQEIFDAPAGSIESEEADILGILVDDYENKQFPIDAPDPIEAIMIRMEELQLKQADLVDDLGGKNLFQKF